MKSNRVTCWKRGRIALRMWREDNRAMVPLAIGLLVLMLAFAFQSVFIEGKGGLPRIDVPAVIGGTTQVAIVQNAQPVMVDSAVASSSSPRVAGARITWAAASFLHFVLAFAAIIGGAVCIRWGQRRLYDILTVRWIIAAALILLSIAIVVMIAGSFRPITDAVVDRIEHQEATNGMLEPMLTFFDALTLAAGLFLMLTSCIVIIDRYGPAQPGMIVDKAWYMAKIRHLRHQHHIIRIILYLGTAELVAMIMRTIAFFDWGRAYCACIDDLTPLFKGATTLWGVNFSLMLAAMYVPAAVIIHRRAVRLAEAVNADDPDADHEEWLRKHGLVGARIDHLPRILAIIAPFLAGQFGEVIKKLG